jgi:2-polyprenyl-6-methoxyphenol hydroxylase-like FAD-dependent oxidoreductase
MLLARAGLDVLVVDRSAYGSDTLSTHALMRAGVMQLHRWGLLDRVIAAGTPAVRTTTFHYADASLPIPVKAAHGIDALYAPRRTVLDPILVDAARAAGATFRFGVTATGVTRDRTGRVDGISGRDSRGARVEHRARWVVGADGLRSVIAKAVDAPTERLGDGVTACIYGYWSGMPQDGFEWIFRPDACAGVIPTNDGRNCVFVVSSPQRMASKDRTDAFEEILNAASPEVAARVAAAGSPVGMRSFPGVPGRMRIPWGPGWSLVGDAGYWKDPIGAHGLTDALRDAELLARAIIESTDGRVTERDAFDQFHQTRNQLSLHFFELVDIIASMRWTDAEIPELLLRFSAAMGDEVEAVAGFDASALVAVA